MQPFKTSQHSPHTPTLHKKNKKTSPTSKNMFSHTFNTSHPAQTSLVLPKEAQATQLNDAVAMSTPTSPNSSGGAPEPTCTPPPPPVYENLFSSSDSSDTDDEPEDKPGESEDKPKVFTISGSDFVEMFSLMDNPKVSLMDKPKVTRGTGKVAQDGKVSTNMAVTWSHAVESDRSAAAVGEPGTPLSFQDLEKIHWHMEQVGATTEFIDMSVEHQGSTIEAAVVVIRDFFNKGIYQELLSVEPKYVDKNMWSYGTCKVKRKRWNTNITDETIEGDIPNPDPKKRCSSQVPFNEYPLLSAARKKIGKLGEILDIDVKDLFCEINYYFPNKGSGIGLHGDVERNLVWGGNISDGTVRVIKWIGFQNNKPMEGREWQVVLNNGDCYIMSEHAAGTDWKKRSRPTIRHCAGNQEFVDKCTAAKNKKRKAAPTKRPKKKIKLDPRAEAIKKIKTKLKGMPGQVTLDEWLQHFGDRIPASQNCAAKTIQRMIRGFLCRRMPKLPHNWSQLSRLAQALHGSKYKWTRSQWIQVYAKRG